MSQIFLVSAASTKEEVSGSIKGSSRVGEDGMRWGVGEWKEQELIHGKRLGEAKALSRG